MHVQPLLLEHYPGDRSIIDSEDVVSDDARNNIEDMDIGLGASDPRYGPTHCQGRDKVRNYLSRPLRAVGKKVLGIEFVSREVLDCS